MCYRVTYNGYFRKDRVQQFVNYGAPIKNPPSRGFFYASIQIYANNGNNAQTQCNCLTQRKTIRLKQNRKNKHKQQRNHEKKEALDIL